jgi:PhnB protein
MTGSRADNVQPIPEGYHGVTPRIISRGRARLIEFLSAAFGAEEIARVVVEDGFIGHAEVRTSDSEVMMFDAKPCGPRHPG